MNFDNPKVYGDTFISDGLVLYGGYIVIVFYWRLSLPRIGDRDSCMCKSLVMEKSLKSVQRIWPKD